MANERSNRSFLVHEIERLKGVIAEKDEIIRKLTDPAGSAEADRKEALKQPRKLTKQGQDKPEREEADK